MRRVGGWSVVALVSFGVLVAVAEAVLKAVHAHWPQGVLVGLGALAGALVGLVKPLQDAVTTAWSKALSGRFERSQQRDALIYATAPGRKDLQRVRDLDGARAVLGIHPCIPLPDGADQSLSRELPLYVPRDIHATVTTWITAHEQTGGFLLLLGPAGAGKTRCLFEALRERLPDAPMLLPKDANQLETLVSTIDGRGSPVVVWLNEIYDLLGADQLTADQIRRALNHTRPLLIVATMWRERYDAMTAEQGKELNRDACEILTRLCDTENLLGSFTEPEIARATQLGARDPRLREVLASVPLAGGTADVTGSLAAKPRLLAHYNHASDPYEHAVLTAAITATHLGHPDPVPRAVLEHLALAQLDPGIRAKADKDWFGPALASACSPLQGLTTAPLEARAEVPGSVDGYRAHDILTQSVKPELRDSDIAILIAHAKPAACVSIGTVLKNQHSRDEEATKALSKAASSRGFKGAYAAAAKLGILLSLQGDMAGARVAFERARDSADPEVVGTANLGLGNVLSLQGDMAGARVAFERARESTNPEVVAMANLGLGNALLYRGGAADARIAFERARHSAHPNIVAGANVGLGLAALIQGDIAGARIALEEGRSVANSEFMAKVDVILDLISLLQGGTGEISDGVNTLQAFSHLALDGDQPEVAKLVREMLAAVKDMSGSRAAGTEATPSGQP